MVDVVDHARKERFVVHRVEEGSDNVADEPLESFSQNPSLLAFAPLPGIDQWSMRREHETSREESCHSAGSETPRHTMEIERSQTTRLESCR